MERSNDTIFQPNPSYERNPEVKEHRKATAELDFEPDYCNEDPITGAYCSLLQNRGSSVKRSNSADDILEQSSGLKLPQVDIATLNTRWSLSSIEDEDSEPQSNGDSSSKHLPTPTSGASRTYHSVDLDSAEDTPAATFHHKEFHPQSTGCEREGIPKGLASTGDLSTAGSTLHVRDAEKRDTQEIPLSFDQTPEKVPKPPEKIKDPDSSDQCNTQSNDREYYNLYYDGDYYNFSKSLPSRASSKQHRDRLASAPPRRQKKPIPLSRGLSDHGRKVRQEEAGHRSSPPVTPRKKGEPNLDWERIRQEVEERPSPPVTPRRVMVKMEQLSTFDKVWQQEAENRPSPPVTLQRPRRSENEDSSGIVDRPKSPLVFSQRSQVQEKESSDVAMPSPPTIIPNFPPISPSNPRK